MAFKMKRTPIKGLGDFFSSLGKEATGARQTKQKASNTGEYAGMTNFEKRRAEKKSRKPGESKFQADVRTRGEAKKAARKSTKQTTNKAGKKIGSELNLKAEDTLTPQSLKSAGYSNATSVNALVKQRDKFRADPKNKGKKYPGQAEINKRLKKNPGKFD